MFDSEWGGLEGEEDDTTSLYIEINQLNQKIRALEQEIVELKKQIPQKKKRLKKT